MIPGPPVQIASANRGNPKGGSRLRFASGPQSTEAGGGRLWQLELELRGLDTLPPAPFSTRPRAPFAPSHWLTPPRHPRREASYRLKPLLGSGAVSSAAGSLASLAWQAASGFVEGKLQAPESAFESRHLRPSWSAPPCGPLATDITRFVSGKTQKEGKTCSRFLVGAFNVALTFNHPTSPHPSLNRGWRCSIQSR